MKTQHFTPVVLKVVDIDPQGSIGPFKGSINSSDGVSRLGLDLETHFCESRSRTFQVSSRSRRFQVSRLWILQRNGLL